MMWSCSSNAVAGSNGPRNFARRPNSLDPGCSDDDEASSTTSREEGLECPICFESFNIVENVPYVLWCGHTLCKNCVLGLQWAVVKFPTSPIQLPLFVSCPWCNLLSLRLVYKGNLKFPRKNFFLLWMVESMNDGRHPKPLPSFHGGNHQPIWPGTPPGTNHHRPIRRDHVERINSSLRRSLAFFVNLTAKFPLVVVFLLIVLYAIPASAAILALYAMITVLFALPSFLMLYFAYPSLNWLVREIVT